MEKMIVFLIPILIALAGLYLLTIPMRLIFRVGIHAACGLVCLMLMNSVAWLTGVLFPINLVTVLIAGIFGVPGIGIMAILEIFGI